MSGKFQAKVAPCCSSRGSIRSFYFRELAGITAFRACNQAFYELHNG
jgi:hypothetical protein